MPASSHPGAGRLALCGGALLFTALSLSGLTACDGDRVALGDPCTRTGDCAEDLQCFELVCTPRCESHVDCGDGYRCGEEGECAQVTSAIGDFCAREIDCGPGQACSLSEDDPPQSGMLTGSCQAQLAGQVTGATCAADDECQIGICALGRCTQLCTEESDCSSELTCATIPRLLADSAPLFSGCLPATGVLIDQIPASGISGTLRVPVSSNAVSFTLVTEVDELEQVVGATRLVAPDGRSLYVSPETPEDFYANPIRYQPDFGASALFVPNTPSVQLQVGVYQVDVASQLALGGPGTEVPRARVLYKVDRGSVIDLHFYFLDLEGHPCASQFDGGRLSGATAPRSERFQKFVADLDAIFGQVDVRVDEVTYHDVSDRGDLDGVHRDRAGELFALAASDGGFNVFFVRSIAPVGVQAVSGGTPGPPATPGSPASGIAISTDTLCYRSWAQVARIAAHAMGRQMGLYNNREPDGQLDAIPDSDASSTNLMFYGDIGGIELSAGQRDVLSRYPGGV